MKILALHLPQFHEVKENNEWWGQGFTEWTNVKSAKPIFRGHIQPKEPIDGYYYDLSKVEDINKQALLARQYGLSGFVFFHYWYEGRHILEKPCEILLDSPQIDIEYCFCWANHSWTRAWDGKEHQVLLGQTYGGEEDWEAHIKYLIPFFKDERYIKNNNKPIFVLYNPSAIPNVDDMVDYWERRIKEEGFSGLYIIEYISSKNTKPSCKKSQAVYEDEPMYTCRFEITAFEKIRRVICKKLQIPDYQTYDRIWKLLLRKNRTYEGRKVIKGCFTAWDNSPRRGKKGPMIVKGASPEKFNNYFKQLVSNDRKDVSSDYLIINAWNEWGEGAILEPSKSDGYGYLEAVHETINEVLNNE